MTFERVEIGPATLYLGDCRDILPTLAPVDLVLTDPPYGIRADRNLRAGKQHGKAAAPSRDYGTGDWDNLPPSAELIESIRAMGAHQIIFGGNYFTLPPSSCWLVWDKENGDNGYADCELAWTNLPQAVRKLRFRWQGMLQENMGAKELREHPTQKPVPVMCWALGQAKGVQTVLDPFMGSGTTGVACVEMDKTFIGIEREPKYFDIACKRIAYAVEQGKQRLFEPEPEPQPEQPGLGLDAAG